MKADTHGILEDDTGVAAFIRDGFRRILRNPRTGIPSVARDGYFKLERRLTRRYSDPEIRQLRALERAYNRRGGGPEVLVFGDSSMYWSTPKDTDRRHLVEMVRTELDLDVGFESLVGPGYNPRIMMVYLSALARCQSQPRVVVVPTSVLMATTVWLSHPVMGWEHGAAELQAAVTANGKRPRRLTRPGPDAENEFDRIPAPSLIGARRTVGELRLITNSEPMTRWQHVVRVRHLMDYYNAERLESDSIGVELVAQLGATLSHADLPSVAYIHPVNHEVIAKVLGPKAPEHVAHNAAVIEAAYLGAAGERGAMVNAIFDSPASEFVDPVHLSYEGRLRLAKGIAAALRPLLAGAAD